MAADKPAGADVVEKLRLMLTPSAPSHIVTRIVMSSDDARAILLRLECAEKMARLVAAIRAEHMGVLLPDCRCDWCVSAKAVLAKWEALRG